MVSYCKNWSELDMIETQMYEIILQRTISVFDSLKYLFPYQIL